MLWENRDVTTRPFSRFTAWATAVFTACFLAWTRLTLRTQVFAGLDASSNVPRLVRDSPVAQVASAFAIVAHPAVMCLLLVVIAIWAWRRRLRHLAVTSLVSGALTMLICQAIKASVNRARPPSPMADAITYQGSSYPSLHMAMAAATAAVVVGVTTTTRQPRWAVVLWRLVGFAFVVAMGFDGWLMNAHHFTDIIAGVLLGAAVVSAVMLFARVRMLPLIAPRHPANAVRPRGGLCAVIYNPAKMRDEMVFRRQLVSELAGAHWEIPLWLPTTIAQPGAAQAREAIARGADLVVAAGGDGTVREVSGALAGSGIPMGIVPSGTANLLAKNVGIPIDMEDAISVAVGGEPTPLDLVRMVVDAQADKPLYFAVMAGIGFDARLMQRTNESLKKALGAAAYVFSAMPELFTKPHRVEISVDGSKQIRRNAVLTVMGNVPSIGGGVELMPDADPTDGRMEMVVGSPVGLSAWARATAQVLTRMGADPTLEQYAGVAMSVEVDEPMPYELDGDLVGSGSLFEAEVDPGALMIMLPPRPSSQAPAAR